MVMQPVSSSNLASVGYENGTLHIGFTNGSLYAYYNVPFAVYQNLMTAPSHGEYFHARIKGIYRYERIG